MHTRRSVLALGTSAMAASTAGCTEQIPFIGDEPMTFSATSASVAPSILDDTGYEEHDVGEVKIEETFEAGGQTQDVVVTNWHAEYDKAIDLGELGMPIEGSQRAAIFTGLATPQVDVLGQTFNPIADMSSEELAGMVQDRYDGLDSLEHVRDASASLAGEPTTIGEFEGEGTLTDEDVSVDLTLHLAEAVESGEDLLVGIGGYPTELGEREADNVFALMDGLEATD